MTDYTLITFGVVTERPRQGKARTPMSGKNIWRLCKTYGQLIGSLHVRRVLLLTTLALPATLELERSTLRGETLLLEAEPLARELDALARLLQRPALLGINKIHDRRTGLGVDNRETRLPETACRRLRPFRYLRIPPQDRERVHLVRERQTR